MNITYRGLLLFLAGTAAIAQASQVTLNFLSFDGSRTDSSGNAVGPYSATVTAGTGSAVPVGIYCDDLTHNINVPGTYTMDTESISNLSGARFYGVSAGTTLPQATALYEQVFYLASFLPGATGNQIGTIGDAIWNLTYPFENNKSSEAAPTITTDVQYWLNKAGANYAGKDYSNWVILTDASSQYSGVQELVYDSKPFSPGITPEPGTVALMFGGVGFLATRLRRSRKS